jgi:hypothetical protein
MNLEVNVITKEYLALVIPWIFILSFGFMRIEGQQKKYRYLILWIKRIVYKEFWL